MKIQKTTYKRNVIVLRKEQIMKYIAFALFLLVAPAWAGTLKYDFEDAGQLKNWKQLVEPEHPSGQWIIENGELLYVSQGKWCFANLLYIGDDTWKDYEVEYRFRIDKTFLPPDCARSYGVIGSLVHIQFGKEYRAIYTGPHDLNGDEIWEGNYSATVTGPTLLGNSISASNVLEKPAELKEKVWYKVQVVARGNQYEWFINDELMWKFEGESPQFAYGAVGLYTRNCEASFDDVTITGDTIPATAVSPHSKLTTIWGKVKQGR